VSYPKAIIVDTNVLIHDPESIETLMNDVNVVFLHTIVIQELDNLKTQRDIGRDCREAIRRIEKLHEEEHPRFRVVQMSYWIHPDLQHLDQNKNDHHIIALAHNIQQSQEFNETKLISKDTTVRILARDIGITVEDYVSENIKIDNTRLKEIEIPYNLIEKNSKGFVFETPDIDDYKENEGVICWSDWDGYYTPQSNSKWQQNFTAIKKGELFHIVDNEISAMGITPYSMNGGPNWEQYIALAQLLDKDIKCLFLIGGSGSGKTLLSMAAALHQRRFFRNILITRPMIHLEDEDRMGFLPGTIEDKMSPWLRPIYRTISFIGSISNDNFKLIEKIRESNKLEIEPLDYIRGMTYVKDLLIVDEAQNLTPHQMKTIITRAGENSKIVFTGDLGQIDRTRKIDASTSGLAYASVKMSGEPMVSTVYFKETVRSELAHLAERLL
jgi:PhoH-like ATPase